MRVAIVVPGRFYAFDLAKALIAQGHDVMVFTNYPKWAVRRFGLASEHITSCWAHGVMARAASRLKDWKFCRYPDSFFYQWFGKWACEQVGRGSWDVIHSFSGSSEEILEKPPTARLQKLVVRASAHIRVQASLLKEEEKRTGWQLEKPSPWVIEREEREYKLADRVIVLSRFAYQSFLAEGIPEQRLLLLLLGADLGVFRPACEAVEARCRRILSGEPLRILFVGALSFRKGMWDVDSIVRSLGNERFRFRFIGPVSKEVKTIVNKLHSLAEFVAKQPQHELPRWYGSGDLFFFPTIEDGFPVVLAQANASALPILTTSNCCGPDLISEGQTGWVLPIRSPAAFVERLRWCDSHRKELAEMVRRIYYDYRPRTWADVATDFEVLCSGAVAANGYQQIS
jgi:glycosyltransferase involved in cell wall biosynthesis